MSGASCRSRLVRLYRSSKRRRNEDFIVVRVRGGFSSQIAFHAESGRRTWQQLEGESRARMRARAIREAMEDGARFIVFRGAADDDDLP